MAGRKPKPTNLKLLQGNPGKRKLNKNEPKPTAKTIPRPPAHLDVVARSEWRRVAPKLFAIGLLTPVDRSALAAYCVAYSKWVEAERAIRDRGMVTVTPNGYPCISAWAVVSNKAMRQMREFMAEFGMTPSSRSRVQVDTDDAESDPFENFLAGA